MTVTGTPTIIHWSRLTRTPASSDAAAAKRTFGGVPIRVPTPPIEAA